MKHPIVSFAVVIAISLLAPQSAYAQAWNVGDIFASVSDGKVEHYDSNLNFIQTLDTGSTGAYTTGMAFDASLNLYVTDFSNALIHRFDATTAGYMGTFGSPDANSSCESLVFDSSGGLYVGQADGTRDIMKFSAGGGFLARYDVATQDRGSDWIDLAADQTTMYYTSEDRGILRYDIANDTQLTDFATLAGAGRAYALRILADGGVLVADTYDIKRLDAAGNVIQTYDVSGQDGWFALNLDPNGTSFWSGDFGNDSFFEFDIATGAQLSSLNTGHGGGNLYGLAVAGEITQGVVPEPSTLLLLGVGGLLGLALKRRIWR
jgi:streptogramin lyase